MKGESGDLGRRVRLTDNSIFLPQAFKCHLCYVRPAFGEWDEEANDRFKDLTWDKKLVAKVKYLYGRVNVQ